MRERTNRWLLLGAMCLLETTLGACGHQGDAGTSDAATSDASATGDADASPVGDADASPVGDADASAPSVVFVLQDGFVEARVDGTTWSSWNSVGPNDSAHIPVSGRAMVQDMTKQLYAAGLPDRYKLIYFVLNNADYPATSYAGDPMPTGEFALVKNDVEGIGVANVDDSAAYGSGGALEGTITLYRRDAILGCGARGWADGSQPTTSATSCGIGPILHETAHRYANWIVPPATGHWDGTPAAGTGRLSSTTVPYSGIELYLLGLVPSSALTGTDAAAYATIPAASATRVPAAGVAPTTQDVLVVVLTPGALGTDPSLDDGVAAHSLAVKVLTSTSFDTDFAALSSTKQALFRLNNYYEQTGNRATLQAPLPATLH